MTSTTPTTYKFGRFELDDSQVFYTSPSQLTYASVNLKPIVPGHILVCPVRSVARVKELTTDELCDMMLTGQYLQAALEDYYNTTAANIAIQDGKDAGQSVAHVHLHILPRRAGDFQRNDDVYEALDKHDSTPKPSAEQQSTMQVDDAQRKPRTAEQMKEEADKYSQFLKEYTRKYPHPTHRSNI